MKKLMRLITVLLILGALPLLSMVLFPSWAEAINTKAWGQDLWLLLIAIATFVLFGALDLLNRSGINKEYQTANDKNGYWSSNFNSARMGFVKTASVVTILLAVVLIGLIIYLMVLPKAPQGNWYLWTIKTCGMGVLMGILYIFNAVTYIHRGSKVILGEDANLPGEKGKIATWQDKLFQLRPSNTDQLYDLKEDFDGISELNNPPPPWFMYLFYSTIVFAVIYLVRFTFMGYGPSQVKEYENDLKEISATWKTGENVDENTVKLIKDQAVLADAKSLFVSKCAVCHGENAEGKNGPNLTDEYWKHGNTVKDIFKTIKNGVLDKGMVAWNGQIPPAKIAALSSYIISLQGSKPANGKAPEGDKMEMTEK